MSGTTVLNSAGLSLFKLSFQISPIILVGGIAGSIPGQMLPIVALTEAASFVNGLLRGAVPDTLDGFFAHFKALPGSTLIDQQLGSYPFANQQVAANAAVAQPLSVSLKMVCPVKDEGGYAAKLVAMIALQQVLAQHNSSGGTYIVATPSFIWLNAVMLRLTDVSSGESKQVQTEWQWDFTVPLLTLAQANSAMNGLMGRLSTGMPTDGSINGGTGGLGATAVTQPAASGLIGTSITTSTSPIIPVTQEPLS